MKAIHPIFFTLCLLTISGCSSWSGHSRTVDDSHETTPATSADNSSYSTLSGSSTELSSADIEDFYIVFGRRYAVMKSSDGFKETGIASWYGEPFHGQKTSNGEIYDMYQMTAAHKHLPLPSFVEVTHLGNGRSIIVRVNDRGPFKDERIIDLSYAAAQKLDMIAAGTARVSIRSLDDLNVDLQAQRQIAAPIHVQVGSYREMSNALNTQDLLRSIGINNSRIVKSNAIGSAPLFRLQVGPITKGSEYDQLTQQLLTIGIRESVIIRD